MKKTNEFNFTSLPLDGLTPVGQGVLEEGLIDAGSGLPLPPRPVAPTPDGGAQGTGPSLEERLSLCPTEPGVYLMKDKNSHVIYVGKAKNLRSRVRSYFQNSRAMAPHTAHMVSKVERLDFLRTSTETEALLLENNLIKKWKPKYNLRLKDDKTYPYLKLDRSHPYPRPYIARRQVKGDGNEYFGPYPNSGYLRQVLRGAAKIFKLRDCRDHDFANRSRPCLSYEIGQCTAPCVNLVTKEGYEKQVQEFVDFLSGDNTADLQGKWQEQMQEASDALDFERAAMLRDRLEALGATMSEQSVVSTDEMGDRDIWAVTPEHLVRKQTEMDAVIASVAKPVEGAEPAEMFLLINQIRGGKWVGSRNARASLENAVIDENFLASLIVQHYTANPAPDQVIIPPDAELSSREELALALPTLNEGSAREIEIRYADEKQTWSKYYDLALENARGLLDESLALQSKKEDGLAAIKSMLDLPLMPVQMECVDISNLQGEANVASCVVFRHGKPDKTQYRHYNIRGFEGQNDFASMKEVMSRRYGKTDSPKPDLLVIDGGKGQLSSVVEVLKAIGVDFPVCALAKARTKSDFKSSDVEASEERIFLPGQKNYIRIKNSEALRILTSIRDEAHRFAIEFHRLKRDKNRGLR